MEVAQYSADSCPMCHAPRHGSTQTLDWVAVYNQPDYHTKTGWMVSPELTAAATVYQQTQMVSRIKVFAAVCLVAATQLSPWGLNITNPLAPGKEATPHTWKG